MPPAGLDSQLRTDLRNRRMLREALNIRTRAPVDIRRNRDGYYAYARNTILPIATSVVSKLVYQYGTKMAANFIQNKMFSNNNKMVVKKSYKKPMVKKTAASKTSVRTNTGQLVSQKRTKKTNYKKKPSLAKQIKDLQKSVKSDQAYHTYKSATATKITTSVGECEHESILVNTATNMETWMANLRYYDPAVPGTLTTANASTGTYSRVIHFKNINCRLNVRNNYQVPCKLRVYLVKPKSDTNISPITYYANGIGDQVINAGADRQTSLIYLNDIDVFKEQWSAKVLKDVQLEPGASVVVSHNTGSYDYDPSLVDSHTDAYQTKYKFFGYIIRIEGVMGHDTSVVDQIGLLNCGVDYEYFIKAEIIYDAGVNLNDIYISDTRDTSFTNSGVCSNKPIADNQPYSVS